MSRQLLNKTNRIEMTITNLKSEAPVKSPNVAIRQYIHILYKFNFMPRSREITFILDDGTDVFIDPRKDDYFHIRYIMPNGLPNVVHWSKDDINDAFFDSNAIEAIRRLNDRLKKLTA
jgi:hypothetical protein